MKTGIIKPDTQAPGLGEAREKLKYYNMSPKERHAYDEHVNAIMIQNDVLGSAKLEGHAEGLTEGLQKGLQEGLEQGLEKGRVEGQKVIAHKMKLKGLSIQDIIDLTGLSKEDIENS